MTFLTQLPSYKNFKGVIQELGPNQCIINGEISVLDTTTIEISELPVRTWTQVPTIEMPLCNQGLSDSTLSDFHFSF